MIGLDVRGRSWSEIADLLDVRPTQERRIIVTDQPVMHLVRNVTGIIEFLPSQLDPSFASTRLAEIKSVYGIEKWEGPEHTQEEPGPTGEAP